MHCAIVSGLKPTDAKWEWLKRYDGMDKAFKAISGSDSKWLPVRRVFGKTAKHLEDNENIKRESLRDDVVAVLVKDAPCLKPAPAP